MSHSPGVWLDHFVVAIDDLDRGTLEFENRTGVRPAFGGEHPSLGTHNALVSLGGDQYLEILAPRPGAALAAMVQDVGRYPTLTPMLWAVATDDLSGLRDVVTRAGFVAGEPSPGARVTEDGETLRWSMFRMGPGRPAGAPFFIHWHPGTIHPSRSTPGGCLLDSYTVASTEPEALRRLLDVIGFQASVTGPGGGSRITLTSPRGAVALGGPG